MTENEEFEKWFEENKKWLYSMDYMQAAYHAWRGGVSYQQAAQQSVRADLLPCGHSGNNRRWRLPEGVEYCFACSETSR